MSDYLTSDQLKATLGLTSTTYDADVAASITAASRAIDNLCNRPHGFWPDPDDVVRYYTPTLTNRLIVDDVVSITSFQVDFNADGVFEETWVENTEYILYPLNTTTPWRPKTWVETHPLSGRFFPIGYPRTVQITGKFGWQAAPDGIYSATSLLATQVFKRVREAPFGVLAFADVAAHIARTDPQFSLMVAPYKRLTA